MQETTVTKTTSVKPKKNSKVLQVLKQMSYNRMAMLGAIILLIEVSLVLLAPVIAPYSYSKIDMTVANQGPSLAHLFGTDDVGRDILSRILYGGRYSLGMGILSILISMVIGMAIGSIAGYFGGAVDNLIMRFLDIVQSMPGMLLTIVLSTVLGPGYFNTILALAINNVPSNARLLRAQTPEWGAMLSGSRQFMNQYPHMVIFPGLAIALTVLSLNLMGDGLRDALDPKLKR